MNPAHRALRDGTAAAHERLDALFGGFNLADAGSYRHFLLAHAEALVPLEEALDAGGADRVIADWPARRRGELLRADLAALGAAMPPAGAIPAPADDAAAAGMIYVLEGSRLGGRFLARQVEPGLPRRFLEPPQERGAWPKLLAMLEQRLYGQAELASAIAAASAVFACFEDAGRRWLKA